MSGQKKPSAIVHGDTFGNFITGELYHAHGVHMQNDGSWKKTLCPTCGYDYDESEFGMPAGKALTDGPYTPSWLVLRKSK